MTQTVSDLLNILDQRRKATGKSWNKLAKEADTPNAKVYRWFRVPGANPTLDLWLLLLKATGGQALLRTKDSRLYPILAPNNTINVAVLSAEAEMKSTRLYKVCDRAGLGNCTVYGWQTGRTPSLKGLLRVLDALDMTVVVREARTT